MKQLTQYQQLAFVRLATGHNIRLQQFEKLTGCLISTDLIILLIKTAQTKAAGRSVLVERSGVKSVTMTRSSGAWGRPVVAVTWDDETPPVKVVTEMPLTSPTERLKWERLCHRPGSPTYPRDSYAREQQGY